MGGLTGDHIVKVLPVPIPNTEVKLSEPMIVHTSVKVGIAGFLKLLCCLQQRSFFMRPGPKLITPRPKGNRFHIPVTKNVS